MRALDCNQKLRLIPPNPKIKYVMNMNPIFPNKLEEKLHVNLAKAEVFGALMRWRWAREK